MKHKFIAMAILATSFGTVMAQDNWNWSKTTDSEAWNKAHPEYQHDIVCSGQRQAMTSVEVNGKREDSNFKICEFNTNYIVLACGAKGEQRLKINIGDYIQCPSDPKYNNPLKTVDTVNKRIEFGKPWLTITLITN